MTTGHELYRFGEFLLDVPERRLFRDGQAVHLPPKAQDLLTALVRRAGRLVSKRELLDLVWPETFVEEGILSVHMTTVRRALGDRARSARFIETVPRAGYRFTASHLRAAGNGSSGMESGTSVERKYDPVALELLGLGRRRLLSASMRELAGAVSVFESAVERDPTYAAAHAGLALAWCAQAELRLAPPTEAYERARTSALRALALDSLCADAQVALAMVLFLGEWDWAGADRSLIRALEANPDYTEAYLLRGRLLEALGRLDEGLQTKLRALEREPLSPIVHLQISLSYWNQRRYDDCIEWANRTLALDPAHLLAREHVAGAYLKKGDVDRHMTENIAHAQTYGVAPEVLAPLQEAYRAGGRAGVVRYQLQQIAGRPGVPAVQLALLHGEAGELDAAFEHLNRAIDDRDPCLVHLAVAPQWDDLRQDPRFDACLARMGLPSVARTALDASR